MQPVGQRPNRWVPLHGTLPDGGAGAAARVWRAGWDRELAHWRAAQQMGEFAKLAELLAQATSHWHQNYLNAAIFRVF